MSTVLLVIICFVFWSFVYRLLSVLCNELLGPLPSHSSTTDLDTASTIMVVISYELVVIKYINQQHRDGISFVSKFKFFCSFSVCV